MTNQDFQIGVNMRDFAYYGTDVSVTHPLGPGLMQSDVNALKARMGACLVRFYASHVALTTQQCIDSVRNALDLLNNAGLKAIVCLDDSLATSGFYVQGTEAYHTEVQGHLTKEYWTGKHYLTAYKNHVQQLVGVLGNHPAVWLWEAGNEYAIIPRSQSDADSDAFLTFIQTFSGWMRSLTDKPISSGLISTLNVFRDPQPRETADQYAAARRRFAIALHTPLDAVSLHYYAGDASKDFVEFDINALKTLKPFYIGELGAQFGLPGRVSFYDSELKQQSDAGACGALAWGYSNAPQLADDQGVTPHFPDYDQITGILGQYMRAAAKPFTRTVIDKMQYLSDVTIPDRTVFQPNAPLPVKKWHVRNTGTTSWGDGYKLVHIGGVLMGGPNEVDLPNLAPGEDGEVDVSPLTAPGAAATYTSIWVPRNPNGQSFWTPLTIVITVSPN